MNTEEYLVHCFPFIVGTHFITYVHRMVPCQSLSPISRLHTGMQDAPQMVVGFVKNKRLNIVTNH